MKLLPKLMLLAVPTLVAACGGGGGDKTCTTKPSTAIAEGIWFGPVSSDNSMSAETIVLENGQYYSIFTEGGSCMWIIEGVVTASGGAFSD